MFFGQDALGLIMGFLHQPPHFGVDRLLRRFGDRLVPDRIAEELFLVRIGIGDRAEFVRRPWRRQ